MFYFSLRGILFKIDKTENKVYLVRVSEPIVELTKREILALIRASQREQTNIVEL